MTPLMMAPQRTLEQRMTALRYANEIRSRRAQLKRDLRAQRTTVVAVLSDPPEWVATMHVLELLLAAPKCGRVLADKALRKARVSPSKTIGGMTVRQRRELLTQLSPSITATVPITDDGRMAVAA